MSRLKSAFDLLRTTFKEFNEDKAPRLAAALSYYTAFSLAPLLIVLIAIAGLVFGQEAVRGQLDEQIQGLVGREGADMIQELIQNVRRPGGNVLASIIGVVTLLFGAAGVFGQLQAALNTVWDVEPKPGRGILGTIKDRFLSFSMVLGVGFLLLVSLVISAGVAAFSTFFTGLVPGTEALLQLINFVIGFAVTALLFAMIYKFLPDVKLQWRDVLVGAAFTALLFSIGRYLIGLYLGNSGVTSTYGAAGSFVILLLWIFYSSQILLFGAEFTQVYARRYGSQVVPKSDAVFTEDAPERKGMPNAPRMPVPAVTAAAAASASRAIQEEAVREAVAADHWQRVEPVVQPTRPEPLRTVFTIMAALSSFLLGFFVANKNMPPSDEERRR